MSRNVSPFIYVPLIGGALCVLFGLLFFRHQVGDAIFFLQNSPSETVQQIADDAGLTEEGARLLYRASPELVPQRVLNRECETQDNLGCIVPGPKIYILDDGGEKTAYEQAVVTAAHEMLHLAYFRLSDEERQRIDQLLSTEFVQSSDRQVLGRIESYHPEDQLDEMHSIFATEVTVINQQLEEHYSQFFEENRREVKEAFKNSQRLLQ